MDKDITSDWNKLNDYCDCDNRCPKCGRLKRNNYNLPYSPYSPWCCNSSNSEVKQ